MNWYGLSCSGLTQFDFVSSKNAYAQNMQRLGIPIHSAPLLSLHSLFAYINIWTCWPRKKKNGLNKVQSDPRLWDLQTNPALVPWGPGSGINCYISWPSSCCLSQPAWWGSGLARNHGLRTQQYGHFPQRGKKKKNAHRPRAVYWANKTSSAKHFGLPHFTLTFSIAIFPSLALPIGGAERLVDLLGKLWRWST